MIWLVALGTTASAYFILAANAWMQHPVGYRMAGDHAEMTSLERVFFQSLQITALLPRDRRGAVDGRACSCSPSRAYWLRRGGDVELFRSSARGRSW